MRKNRVIGTIAAAAISVGALGATTLASGSAQAATPSAGHNAIEPYTKIFGQRFVLDVEGANLQQHAKMILWPASNSDKAEDFTPRNVGTVRDFANSGLVSQAFANRYGSLQAFQLEYTPDGRGTGMGPGTWPGEAPQPGFKLRLEPLGQGPNTVWVVSNQHGRFMEFISAASTSFSNPVVLSWPSFDSVPQDTPRPWLDVLPAQHYSNGAGLDTQMWAYRTGVIR